MSKSDEKRTYKKGFKQSWESNPILKDWIQAVPENSNKAYCRLCRCYLYAHRYSFLKHAATIKHQQNFRKNKNNEVQSHTSEVIDMPISSVELTTALTESIAMPLPEQKTKKKIIIFHSAATDDSKHRTLIENVENTDELIVQDEQPDEFFTFQTSPDDDNIDSHEIHHFQEDADFPEEIEENMSNSELILDDQTSSPYQIEETMELVKPPISTHILDTSRGTAAANVPVSLYKLIDSRWTLISESSTNSDGRCAELITASEFSPGRYKLHFDVKIYFQSYGTPTIYPFIEVVFDCEGSEHYHIPLLLNPFGYSTYKGT